MKPVRTSPWRTKKAFTISCSGFFIDNLDHVHNWAGKDYLNVKWVWPLCVYIKLDNRILFIIFIYNYIFIYSKCKLKLICIELSELIIYWKYAWKFSVLEVLYYIFLYYPFLPIHSSLTLKDIWEIHQAWKSWFLLSTYKHAK